MEVNRFLLEFSQLRQHKRSGYKVTLNSSVPCVNWQNEGKHFLFRYCLRWHKFEKISSNAFCYWSRSGDSVYNRKQNTARDGWVLFVFCSYLFMSESKKKKKHFSGQKEQERNALSSYLKKRNKKEEKEQNNKKCIIKWLVINTMASHTGSQYLWSCRTGGLYVTFKMDFRLENTESCSKYTIHTLSKYE